MVEQTFNKIILKSGGTVNQGGYIVASDKGDMQVYADRGDLYLTAYGNIILTSATGTWIQIGTEHDPSNLITHGGIIAGTNIKVRGESGGTIYSGAEKPNIGKNGDIFLNTGAESGLWHKKAGVWVRL